MKRYFIKETGEELVIGDVIALELRKELEDGEVTYGQTLKVTEETIPFLTNIGFIEEKETIDFTEDEESGYGIEDWLNELTEDVNDLEDRIDKLEDSMGKCLKMTKELLVMVDKAIKEETAKPKSSKKK